jgi:ferrochelatase
MTFESLAKIVGAKIINTPTISAYKNISFNPLEIRRGDLFIGNNYEQIKVAIENGAHGILYDKQLQVCDKEIAWFFVESLKESVIKLLKFYLLAKQQKFYFFNTIETSILKNLAHKYDIVYLNNDMQLCLNRLLDSTKDTLFVTSNQSFLKRIYPNFQKKDFVSHQINITNKTLFSTSFIYKEIYYEHIKIPPYLIPYLENSINFLEYKDVSYDIHSFDMKECIYPQFISKSLKLRNFGNSSRVLIIHSNLTLLEKTIAHYHTDALWANIELFIPINSSLNIRTDLKTTYYKELQEIEKYKNQNFNFILILADYNKISNILINLNKEQQLALF